ncbi:MAG: hypothetical protein FWC22_00880 [Treponema sp.]|nr:hypothetical protein [Treponema sp.]
MIKKNGFLIFLFFIFTVNSYTQSSGAYLIPRQIYVGDPSVLVVPLASALNNDDIILTKDKFFHDENYFPSDPDIDFHRIILERRVSGSRLLIEFTAFVPGLIKFPVIEIGGEYFSGLTVMVNSTIDGTSDRILSGTASSLAMPGTALLLYGSMAAVVFIILLTIWFIIKGRAIINKLLEKWKRNKLFTGIRKTEKHLQRAVLKGVERREILDKLSDETREFLSILTGSNCRALTACEFELLPVNAQIKEEELSLGDFFHNCDKLRFSGVNIKDKEILQLLDALLKFTDILEKPKEKENKGEAA